MYATTLDRANAGLIAFDLTLGLAALTVPARTLQALGHRSPGDETTALFRRCGPVWLTYAAAHALASRRGSGRDWAGVAWLRATEIGTDALWATSPGFRASRRARLSLRAASAFNLWITVAAARRAAALPGSA